MNIKNYQNFKKIQEVRRPKQCPILDFTPLIESETYKDMIGMGFSEVTRDQYTDELVTIRRGDEKSFKDRLGNFGFYHPFFKNSRLTNRASSNKKEGYPYFNIRHNGAFRVCEGPNNSAEFPYLHDDLRRKCMTIEDYLYKMSFLIKYTVKQQGFPMNNDELYGNEPYKDLILRKMSENPRVIKNIIIPPSISKTDAAVTSSILKRFNFGE